MEKKIIGAVFIIMALIVLKPFTTIDEGERGVKLTFGEASNNISQPGLVLYVPVIQTVAIFDVKTIKYENTTQVYTKDIQQAHVGIAINVHLDPARVIETYRQYGTDWFRRLVAQRIEDSTKTAIGKWEAANLIENRDKAANDIKEMLLQSLEGYPVVVEAVQITNIDYTDDFEKAIEEKVVAVQNAIKAQNNTVRIKEEANQKIISAQAEAESMRIRANALTQNASLVQYEAVQKWNGTLPQYMLGNTVPFIGLDKK